MRHLLISLIERSAAQAAEADGKVHYNGGQYKGLLPLADGRLIFAQLDLGKAMGVENIFCLVETIPPEISEIEDYAMRLNMRFSLVRTIADISANVRNDDELLLLADGLVVTNELFDRLRDEQGQYIICFSPEDLPIGHSDLPAESGFERIDMNHLWAGISLLKGRELFDVRELPSEWDVQSAALRVTVQRNYRRSIWPWALVNQGQIAHISNARHARKMSRQLARSLPRRNAGLSPSIWHVSIFDRLTEYLWQFDKSRALLLIMALIMPLIATGLALYGWLLPSLILLAIGRSAHSLYRHAFGSFAAMRDFDGLSHTHYGLSALAIIMVMLRLPDINAPLVVLGIALAGLGVNYLLRAISFRNMEMPLSAPLARNQALPQSVEDQDSQDDQDRQAGATDRLSSAIGLVLSSHLGFLLCALLALFFDQLLNLSLFWLLAMIGWLIHDLGQKQP